MANLMQASQQWAFRPDDQRFTSMEELRANVARLKRGLSLLPRKN